MLVTDHSPEVILFLSEPSKVTAPNTRASHGSGSVEYMATVRRASTPLNSPVTE